MPSGYTKTLGVGGWERKMKDHNEFLHDDDATNAWRKEYRFSRSIVMLAHIWWVALTLLILSYDEAALRAASSRNWPPLALIGRREFEL